MGANMLLEAGARLSQEPVLQSWGTLAEWELGGRQGLEDGRRRPWGCRAELAGWCSSYRLLCVHSHPRGQHEAR